MFTLFFKLYETLNIPHKYIYTYIYNIYKYICKYMYIFILYIILIY